MYQVFLLSKNTNGKFRFAEIYCSEEWNDNYGYVIQRSYGQVGGKTTYAPEIYISKGKANRTIIQQKDLKISSLRKEYLDKGYKLVNKHPNTMSIEEMQEIYGDVATNQDGIIKPMLAKKQDDIKNRKIFDKEWLVSPKIDGIRIMLYYKDGAIHTVSRGGSTYEYSIQHILKHPKLLDWFNKNPDIILDGELYKKNVSLQQISGAVRKEQLSDWLEFYLFDIADVNLKAKDRYTKLLKIGKELSLKFKPYKEWEEDDLKIQLTPHIFIKTEEKIWKYHNYAVSLGWEGCVIRDPEQVYRPNSKSQDMIKFKKYKSEDFLVIGYELGLRGSEDMTFICELSDGRTFKAMPVGDRATKEEYIKNFEDTYKNHKAECTFFNYSDEGIPTQPKLRHFRFDLE